jgi:hypothetical protein
VAKAKATKVPVTVRAVIQRINRKLKPDLEALKVSRSERMRQEVGWYYIIDYKMNAITHHRVDPEKLARELGVLQDWEAVTE